MVNSSHSAAAVRFVFEDLMANSHTSQKLITLAMHGDMICIDMTPIKGLC
jgi:hypothetical protein